MIVAFALAVAVLLPLGLLIGFAAFVIWLIVRPKPSNGPSPLPFPLEDHRAQ